MWVAEMKGTKLLYWLIVVVEIIGVLFVLSQKTLGDIYKYISNDL